MQTLIILIIDYGDVSYFDLNAEILNKLDLFLNSCIRLQYGHVSALRSEFKMVTYSSLPQSASTYYPIFSLFPILFASLVSLRQSRLPELFVLCATDTTLECAATPNQDVHQPFCIQQERR